MRDRFKRFNSGRAVLFLVAMIAVFMTGAVLKITADVILSFVIALLLAIAMSPLIKLLGKLRVPRVVSIVLSGILIIASLIMIGAFFYSSILAILKAYPRYESRITEIYIWLAEFLEFSYNEELSIFENLWAQLGIRNQVRVMTFSLSNGFVTFIRNAVMVALFVVFLLFEAVFIKDKLMVAFEGEKAGQITKMTRDIMSQVSRYLSVKFFISLANGLLIALFLQFVGLEFAMMWGIIQFFLNFIPVLGSITVGVLASLFGIIQFWPQPGPIFLVILIMLGVNIVIGNILDPKIMGDRLGLAPIAVLLPLTIWGFIWGFAGMVIAVPMTVIIKIICENVTVLEPISIILGSRRSVLAKKLQYENESIEDAKKMEAEKEKSTVDISAK